MSDWQPIETAPKDGTPIQAHIPGHGDKNIIAWSFGFEDETGEDCAAWFIYDDKKPPKSWTDGVCWASNDDEKPSIKPTHWRPLPTKNEVKGK